MEFHYRAGDERCPSAGAAATSANSETAATRVPNVLVGGDGAGYHGENSPPPASDPDELRRRAAKERIRARILREEAETMALEAEVRRELMEERARLLVGLAGGSEHRAVPSLKTVAPYFHESVQAGSKVDVSAAVPGKRKNPDVHDTSAVLAATGSKKPKPDLTCTVCNITATSEVALQEHLGGKSHGKKAAKHAQPLPGTGQPEEDAFSLKVNGSPALPAKGKNPSVAVASMALAEKRCDNLGLNCTVCGITASSQKNMQDHLKWKIHMRKTAMIAQLYPKENGMSLGTELDFRGLKGYLSMIAEKPIVCSKPNASAAVLPAKRKNSDVVPAASTLSAGPSSKNQKRDLTCTATSEKGMKDHLKGKAHMKMAASLAPGEAEEDAEVEGGYTPRKFHMLTDSGTLCEVVQLNGSILCEVCDVQTADIVTMMCHLQGTKHVSKQAKQKQCEAVEPPAATAAGGDGPGSEMVPAGASDVGRVDGGSLLCELCNVKVPSECAMQSHLSGRKHTNKAKVAAVGVGACGNGSGSEIVPMEANGVRRLDGGILLCELCDVKAPSECVMQTHLSGRKHINKQKANVDAGAGQGVKKAAAADATIGSPSKEAASIVVNGSDDSVKKPAAGEMEVAVSSAGQGGKKAAAAAATIGSSSKEATSIVVNGSDDSGKKPAAGEMEVAVSSAGQGGKKAAAAAATIGSSSKEATSIVVNGSDDSGKKPAAGEMEVAVSSAGQGVKKAAAADDTIGSSSKEAANIIVKGSDDSVKKPTAGEMEVVVSSATPQVDVAAPVCARVSSVPPMEVDEAAGAGDGAAKAEEQEKADAEEEGAVEIDGGAAVTGEDYNIKVEGKQFVTLRQADHSLSCGLCGVHGCDKRGMISHLYTRDHWRRARLAEEKKRASEAALEAVNKDGDGVPVTDGAAQVDN
uniref:C2H2-type domain-containing protein n=1 Tax=Aegilops tauschii TaxID=37682 RepID=R7W9T7_AEGTA